MQEGKKAKNNICEPSPRVELGSSELRGPLGGRGRGGGSKILGTKGNCSLSPTWPVGGSECFALPWAQSASDLGSRKNRKAVRASLFAGVGWGLGRLLTVFLADEIVLISAELEPGPL